MKACFRVIDKLRDSSKTDSNRHRIWSLLVQWLIGNALKRRPFRSSSKNSDLTLTVELTNSSDAIRN